MLDLDRLISDDPTDVDGWAVLADLLAARGDPRGALINLHLAAERDAAESEAARAYVFEHRARFLGPLADRPSQWVIAWHRGYIRRLDMTVAGHCEAGADVIRHLAQTGGLARLEHLRLIGSANFDAVLRAVLEAHPTRLKVLDVGPINMGAGRTDVPIQSLLDRFEHLEELRVQLPASLQNLRHSTLRGLRVAAFAQTFAGISLGGLPALETLELYSRDPVSAAQIAGVRAAPIERIELHTHTAVGWLAAAGPWPTRLVLHSPTQAAVDRAAAIRMPVQYGSTRRGAADFTLTPARQLAAREFIKGTRFWRIHREGAELVIRYGKVGRAGRTLRVRQVNAYEASRGYCDRHAKKLAEGYVEVFVPAAQGGPAPSLMR